MDTNLKEIAEVIYRQMYPNPTDESPLQLEVVMAAARYVYASAMWILAKQERAQSGTFEIPSELLSEVELEVKDGKIDISGIQALRSLPEDMWLQNVGGLNCSCHYVKSTLNRSQLMCDDDSLGDGVRTYFPQGDFIVLPKGSHKPSLTVIYANMGDRVSDDTPISGAVGDVVMQKLQVQFLGKVAPEDQTNNSSSNN